MTVQRLFTEGDVRDLLETMAFRAYGLGVVACAGETTAGETIVDSGWLTAQIDAALAAEGKVGPDVEDGAGLALLERAADWAAADADEAVSAHGMVHHRRGRVCASRVVDGGVFAVSSYDDEVEARKALQRIMAESAWGPE